MGIIRRQAFWNTIINYLGAGIGALNYIYLLPKFFPTEYIGLIRLILSIVFFLQPFAFLGLHSAIVKFYSYFREDLPKQRFFIRYILKIILFTTILTVGTYLLLKPLFLKIYLEKSSLYIDYFYYLIPVFLGQVLYYLIYALGQVLYKTVLTNFFNEVLARLLLTFSILASLFGGYSPDEVTKFYFVAYFFLMLLGIPVLFTGKNKLKISGKQEILPWQQRKEWLKYGGYVLLAGTTNILLTTIDSLMLGSFLGLKSVGVYSIYMYLATMLLLPSRALGRITMSFIADAMAQKDWEKVLRIYHRTSLIQSSLGLLLFLIIYLNLDLFIHIIKKPEFYAGNSYLVFVFLGIGFWIEITGGSNEYILSTSDKYKYDLYFTVSIGALNIVFNLLFIQLWGIIGASLATALSYALLNFLRWHFLKKNYHLQPYDKTFFFIICSAVFAYLLTHFLPELSNIWLNALLKSLVFTIAYLFPLLYFKWVPDFNDFLHLIIQKLSGKK